MDTVKLLIELASSYPHRLKTRSGGACLILFTAVIFYPLRFIPRELLALFELSPPPGVITVAWVLSVTGLAFGGWLFWSGRKILRPRKRKIVVFCIERKNVRIHSYYVQSLDLLRSFLADSGLSDEIEIRDIGSDIIKSDGDARNYVLKNNVVVAFHGRLFLDQEDEDYIHHYKFRVTWRNPPQISEKIRNLLAIDGNLFCSNRNWEIHEVDSKNDQARIAGAFREIILFLVVVSQLTEQASTEKNIAFLERVRRLIAQDNDGLKVTLRAGEKVPKEALPVLRQGRVNALLRDLYLDYAGIKIREGGYKPAKRVLISALKIPGDKKGQIGILVPLAFCCYHLGEIPEAKKYSLQIEEIDRRNANALVNIAFLEILDQNYGKAVSYYKKFLFGEYHDQYLVTQVVEFLGARSEENQEELAFKFGLGAINLVYFDEQQGITDLTKFVELAGKANKYGGMVALTNRLLSDGLEQTKKYYSKQASRKRNRKRKKVSS